MLLACFPSADLAYEKMVIMVLMKENSNGGNLFVVKVPFCVLRLRILGQAVRNMKEETANKATKSRGWVDKGVK